MARQVDVTAAAALADHAEIAHLAPAVQQLRSEAEAVVRRLRGRTVWMLNSTAAGGGVAEMLPTMVALLRDLGIATKWAVIESEDDAFFHLTKRIHNLIHGSGQAGLSAEDRTLFERVNAENAQALLPLVADGDFLAVHDPQPMPLAGMLKRERRVRAVWRCHIGLDQDTAETRDAWRFLEPYGAAYDYGVFSAPEYIAPFLAGRSTMIYPAIDPLTHKNRHLHIHAVVGILSNAGLVGRVGPVVRPPFEDQAQRLNGNGRFASARAPEDIGLLHRPIITQISRWDRLKGFLPLLQGFAEFKRRCHAGELPPMGELHDRRRALVRLVLAGPDPDSVADDPEGQVVIEELAAAYRELPAEIQADIAVVALPMRVPAENALMVNALQRASTIVVQNSLREGFGLTITEAMWKRVPVLTNSMAVGPRQQIRDNLDGRLLQDPTDRTALADALDAMLADSAGRSAWGRNAQRRAHDHFLVYAQLRGWLRLLNDLA
ncbi:MAG: glycosyltransferase [Gemmatimonadota bacterium]